MPSQTTERPNKLLIVDDDELLLRSLADLFRSISFAPHCAHDKEEVEALLSAYTYDVALVDLGLTGCELDGLYVIERLRKQDPPPIIIAYSGMLSPAGEQSAISKGAAVFLRKPFKLAEFESALANAAEPTHSVAKHLIEDLRVPVFSDTGMSTMVQPIVDVSRSPFRITGVECLTRGPHQTLFERPDVLFQYCRSKGLAEHADLTATSLALARCATLSPDWRISLNVHATTLSRGPVFVDWFLQTAAEQSRPLDKYVLEIVEVPMDFSIKQLVLQVRRLRDCGVKIALDDYGTGTSNLQMLIQLTPDVVKLDRSIIAGCNRNPLQSGAMCLLADFGARYGFEVVAEGVESVEELDAVQRSGIGLVQGYFFHRPVPVSSSNLLQAHLDAMYHCNSAEWRAERNVQID